MGELAALLEVDDIHKMARAHFKSIFMSVWVLYIPPQPSTEVGGVELLKDMAQVMIR